jgi:hypothetical protein
MSVGLELWEEVVAEGREKLAALATRQREETVWVG